MILQNHFSLTRFYKALKYDLVLNSKTYLFFVVGLLFGLLFIDLFFTLFVVSIVIVVGTSFPLLRNNKSAANYLMLPASVFEKFLLQFIIRVLCFSIIYILLFWIDFKISKAIYNLFEWRRHTEVGTFALFDPFKYKGFKTSLDIIAAVGWLVALSSFLFAGAAYFKKHALFKTILNFVLVIVFALIVSSVFTSIFFTERFISNRNIIDVSSYKISDNLFNTQLFFYVIGIVSSLFLLPLAYFKLKEKEL